MLSIYCKQDDVVEVDGVKYEINASFDNILNLIDLLNEKKLPDHRKLTLGIAMLFGQELPYELPELNTIFNQVFEEYVNQEKSNPVQVDIAGNPLPAYTKDRENFYSLTHDSDFIYAGFMQAYQLDLIDQQGKLHWFKFQSLLAGLPESTRFREIVAIRMWKKPAKNETEEKRMSQLQEFYKLPEEEVN